MKTETYRGRELRVSTGRKDGHGIAVITVNDAILTIASTDETKILSNLRRTIDFIGDDIRGDRWAAHWYAPGTYRLCDEGAHPVALDGECRHFTCVRKREASA